MTKVLVVGYYGYSNSGDDAILSSICHDLKSIQAPIEIAVLSNQPDVTEKDYQVKAYRRFNLLEVIKAIRSCDILLMGGGSLLQDVSSSKSLYYYLTVIRMAKLFKKKVMLYANGIGPISRKFNRKLTKLVANKIDMITLREALSEKTLFEMGISKPEIHVTADPVFGLNAQGDTIHDESSKKVVEGPYMTVMVREWKGLERYIGQMAEIFDTVGSRYNMTTVFIPMKYPSDVDISYAVERKMLTTSKVINQHLTSDEIMSIIGGATVVLSMRLHALIYSAIQGIPMIGFEYDPKIDYYMQALEMPMAGHVSNLDVELAVAVIDQVMADLESYRDHVRVSALKMKDKAGDNVLLLEGLLR